MPRIKAQVPPFPRKLLNGLLKTDYIKISRAYSGHRVLIPQICKQKYLAS